MQKLRCAQHLSWRDLKDHIIILDSQKNQMVHHLEGVGALIWRGLNESLSIEEISNQLVNEFDVELTRAKNDITEFIENLSNNGLLES